MNSVLYSHVLESRQGASTMPSIYCDRPRKSTGCRLPGQLYT